MEHSTDRSADPVKQLLNLFLYAPLGLLARGSEEYPDLVKRGRANATNARAVGSFALSMGNTKAKARMAEAESHFGEFLRIISASADKKMNPVSKDVHVGEVLTSVNDIIADYDTLSASVIVKSLANLDSPSLTRLEDYERVGRNRVTVLNRISQLRR